MIEVSRHAEDPAVWSDAQRTQEVGREKKSLENVVLLLESLEKQLQDADELLQIAIEENDEVVLQSIEVDVLQLQNTIADMEFRRMFSHPMHPCNCFVDIHSGSGGTDAQDWAQILEGMYVRYCESLHSVVSFLYVSS